MKKIISLLFLSSCLSLSAIASQTTSTTNLDLAKKRWSAVTSLDTRAGLENETGAPGALTSSAKGIFGYDLGNDHKASMMIGAYRDHRKAERNNELYNGYIDLSKKWTLSPVLSISNSTRGYLPMSRIERENKSLRTKLQVSPSITANLTPFGLKGVSVTYNITAGYSFYKYQTSIAGPVNTRNTLTNLISISYKATKNLTLGSYFSNTNNWTYYGTRRPDSFAFELNGSFQFMKKLSVKAGYTVGDTTYGYDGTSMNIDLLNLTKSSVYTALTYTF